MFIASLRPKLFLLSLILINLSASTVFAQMCVEPSYRAATTFNTGTIEPLKFVTADFNKDGHPDLVTGGRSLSFSRNTTIAVLLGNPGGTFRSPVILPYATGVLATGDFNGDGNADIVTTGLRFFYGDGAGNLSDPIELFVPFDDELSLYVADFNSDGRTDLYYLNRASPPFGTVLLSNSSGGFSQIPGPSAIKPNNLRFGDFNGDSKIDFVGVNSQGIQVSLGDGAGHFTAQSIHTATSFSGQGSPVVADFNEDNKLDVIITRTTGSRTIFPGDGNGNFGPSVSEQTITGPALAADFNGDGHMDLLGGASSSTFIISLGDGAGHFTDLPAQVLGNSSGLVVDDFNDDGKLDIASNNIFSDEVSVVFGDGTGNFAAANAYPVGSDAVSIAVGDFGGDGKTDFAVVEGSIPRFNIYSGNGSGSFTQEPPVTVGLNVSYRYLDSGDFNRDGKTDLLAVGAPPGFILVTFGGAIGLGPQTRNISFPGVTFVDTGDINGDGKLDFIAMSPGSYMTVLGSGTGNFTATSPVNFGTTALSVELADFTGDGKLDLAVAHETPSVSILVGDGAGGFTPGTPVSVNSNFNQPRSLAAADFNADSKIDLAVANRDGEDFQIFLGNGNGTFGPPTSYAAIDGPRQVVATDLNSDGRPDIALMNIATSASVSIFINDGNGGFRKKINHVVGADSRRMAFSDFNSDGTLDFALVSNPSSAVILLSTPCTGADLSITNTHVGNFAVNAPGVYKLTVNNFSFSRTVGATTLTDQLPPGLSFVSATGAGWQCSANGQLVTCTHDAQIEVGEQSSVTLTVNPTSVAIPGVVNSATVSHPLDTNHDNDSATDVTTVNGGVNITGRVVDQNGNGLTGATVVLRGVVTLTSTTSANGSYSFTGLPEGLTYIVAASNNGFYFTPATRVFRNLFGGASGDFVGRSQTNGKIVVSRNTSGPVNIWTMNADGSGAVRLTTGSAHDTKPQWSPDGTMIAFQRSESSTTAIWVMNADGSNLRRVTPADGNGPVWSPDGRTLAFTKSESAFPGVYTINLDGTNEHRIFTGSGSSLLAPLSWSPDGSAIAFTRQPLAPTPFNTNLHLYTMEPNGTAQKLIVNNPGRQDLEADYSPDGLKIVYLTFDSHITWDLAIANSDGTGQVVLGRVETLSNPSWSPDGTKLLFIQNGKVQISNPDGTGRISLPGALEDRDPDWQPVRAGGGPTQLDDAEFFVRQHYQDFLNRTPDPSGLAFWRNEITSCGTDQQCVELKRINVSAAFFLSIEFRQTGYFVERLYKTAYGDGDGISTFGGSHHLPVPIVRMNEFLPDTQQIGQGVVVGEPGWEALLDNNRRLFVAEFVERPRFKSAYPVAMSAQDFVVTLDTRAGHPLSQPERDQLIAELTSGAKTRAQVVQAIAEDNDLVAAEFNRAFVLMQYFGYLRRNPNDPQDSDYTGYDFWLSKLNQFNGDFVSAEMVKAFITSSEYRSRF